jgi:hypothetical protein
MTERVTIVTLHFVVKSQLGSVHECHADVTSCPCRAGNCGRSRSGPSLVALPVRQLCLSSFRALSFVRF